MNLLENPRFSKSNLWIFLGLLALAGIVSVIFAQQVATGWVALGERINISRRDLNQAEIAVLVGTGIWGLLVVWVALTNYLNPAYIRIQDYFTEGKRSPTIILV